MSCLVLHLIILCLTTKPLRYAWHFLASSCQRVLLLMVLLPLKPPSPSLRVFADTTQDSARLDSTQFDSPLAMSFIATDAFMNASVIAIIEPKYDINTVNEYLILRFVASAGSYSPISPLPLIHAILFVYTFNEAVALDISCRVWSDSACVCVCAGARTGAELCLCERKRAFAWQRAKVVERFHCILHT